jgi:hypothetical protein
MNPVVKRILVHGGFTAGVLALVGLLFAELAGIWTAGNAGKPTSADLNPPLADSLRYRVPLTMAAGGFLFVAVCELVAWRVRGSKKPVAKTAEPPPDDAETLLNELLAQAEAKMAMERGQGSGDRGQEEGEKKTEEQKTEGAVQKPSAPPM